MTSAKIDVTSEQLRGTNIDLIIAGDVDTQIDDGQIAFAFAIDI